VPELQAVAVPCLSQTVSISAAERGHKEQKRQQTKARNALKPEKMEKLVITSTSARAQRRHEEEVHQLHKALARRPIEEPANVTVDLDLTGAPSDVMSQGESEEDASLQEVRGAMKMWWVEELFMIGVDKTDKALLEVQVSSLDTALGWRGVRNYLEQWESSFLRDDADDILQNFKEKYMLVYLAVQGEGGCEYSCEDRVIINVVRGMVGRHEEWMVVTNKLKVVEKLDGPAELSQLPIPKTRSGRGRGQPQPRDYRRTLPIDADLHRDIRRSRFNLQPGGIRLIRENEEAGQRSN
jgi:hypothetical protein